MVACEIRAMTHEKYKSSVNVKYKSQTSVFSKVFVPFHFLMSFLIRLVGVVGWYIQLHGTRPLGPHTFLHRINTSRVKIRPIIKNLWNLFHKVEYVKSWYCENNYNLRKWLWPLIIFAKRSIPEVWQGSKYASGSEYSRVTQGSQYAWIIPEYAGIRVNKPKTTWMAFDLHFPVKIPCLLHDTRNMKLLSSRDMILLQ